MCELLAMSSRFPTNVSFSLLEFSRHGGDTGPHKDGWGIAYAMGQDFRIIKEPKAAAESDCVRYLQTHRFESQLVVSHIRRATIPKLLTFENTHPFDRELFGRRFLFAHNGHMPELASLSNGSPQRFSPLGETDSEQAFCLILDRLADRVHRAEDYDYRILWEILADLSPRLLELGRCNFLLSDSERLFAHGDNSLHSVSRTCEAETHSLASSELRMELVNKSFQQASVIATQPLTKEEDWSPFRRGEIRVFSEGTLLQP